MYRPLGKIPMGPLGHGCLFVCCKLAIVWFVGLQAPVSIEAMAAEAVVTLDDDARADLLVEVFQVAVAPSVIERIKAASTPDNQMFEIGNDKSDKAVNISHIKDCSEVLVEIGRRFHNNNIEVPCKVVARQALLKFDTTHNGKLSHARTLKNKGQIVLKKSDQHNWAKKNGDVLGKIITWFKKLRKSSKSHDPAVAHIKSFWSNHDSDDEDLYHGSNLYCRHRETFAFRANLVSRFYNPVDQA